MTDRRYSDEEVAAIFARATEVQQNPLARLASNEGMSLTELQAIGREAGIAPELVAQAARELEQPRAPAMPTFLGMPLGVARTVELGRLMSDAEWERLVVRLRETFDARGTLSAQGSLRQWTNGNLQVFLEPSGEGHRVRFRTVKGDARSLMTVGISMLAVSGLLVFIASLTGSAEVARAISAVGGAAMVGAALAGAGAMRLPGWLKKRRTQMDQLASELLRITDKS